MKIHEFITEGGWVDTATQQTILTPAIVKEALQVAKQFTIDFNRYLSAKDIPLVKMGEPTGSSAYYDIDKPDKEYGDIDLQMIAPDTDKTHAETVKLYKSLLIDFVNTVTPSYIYKEGTNSNGIIVKIKDDFVQIDLLWTVQELHDWSRWRVTPEQGVKGLIYGNMYSSLGEIMNLSIQAAGVQMKVKDGQPVNFQKSRKVDEVRTLGTDIEMFGYDILKAIYADVNGSSNGLKISDSLKKNHGLKKSKVKVIDLANTIKALADSFELNDLFGKHVLRDHSSKEEFLQTFLTHFIKKADASANSSKFNKATSPEALAKVQRVRDQISSGVNLVKSAFNS